MVLSLLANRRIWFVLAFALLLLLAVSYVLTETTLSAALSSQIYLPHVKFAQACSTVPCP